MSPTSIKPKSKWNRWISNIDTTNKEERRKAFMWNQWSKKSISQQKPSMPISDYSKNHEIVDGKFSKFSDIASSIELLCHNSNSQSLKSEYDNFLNQVRNYKRKLVFNVLEIVASCRGNVKIDELKRINLLVKNAITNVKAIFNNIKKIEKVSNWESLNLDKKLRKWGNAFAESCINEEAKVPPLPSEFFDSSLGLENSETLHKALEEFKKISSMLYQTEDQSMVKDQIYDFVTQINVIISTVAGNIDEGCLDKILELIIEKVDFIENASKESDDATQSTDKNTQDTATFDNKTSKEENYESDIEDKAPIEGLEYETEEIEEDVEDIESTKDNDNNENINKIQNYKEDPDPDDTIVADDESLTDEYDDYDQSNIDEDKDDDDDDGEILSETKVEDDFDPEDDYLNDDIDDELEDLNDGVEDENIQSKNSKTTNFDEDDEYEDDLPTFKSSNIKPKRKHQQSRLRNGKTIKNKEERLAQNSQANGTITYEKLSELFESSLQKALAAVLQSQNNLPNLRNGIPNFNSPNPMFLPNQMNPFYGAPHVVIYKPPTENVGKDVSNENNFINYGNFENQDMPVVEPIISTKSETISSKEKMDKEGIGESNEVLPIEENSENLQNSGDLNEFVTKTSNKQKQIKNRPRQKKTKLSVSKNELQEPEENKEEIDEEFMNYDIY